MQHHHHCGRDCGRDCGRGSTCQCGCYAVPAAVRHDRSAQPLAYMSNHCCFGITVVLPSLLLCMTPTLHGCHQFDSYWHSHPLSRALLWSNSPLFCTLSFFTMHILTIPACMSTHRVTYQVQGGGFTTRYEKAAGRAGHLDRHSGLYMCKRHCTAKPWQYNIIINVALPHRAATTDAVET